MVKLSGGCGGSTVHRARAVPRPVIGPWDFADDKAFLVLAIIVLVVVGRVAVVHIRGGTIGRTLQSATR